MRILTCCAIATLCLGLAACGEGAGAASTQPPPGEPDIVGTITAVEAFQPVTEGCVDPDTADPDQSVSSDDPPFCTREDNDTLGWVRIEEQPSQEAGDNKMVLRIGSGSALLRETTEGHEPAAFGDLREGTTAAAWSTGPVAESYPAQAEAAAIVILD